MSCSPLLRNVGDGGGTVVERVLWDLKILTSMKFLVDLVG